MGTGRGDRRPAGADSAGGGEAFRTASPGDEAAALRAYAADPLRFVREVLGVTLWQKQEEVLAALLAHPRTTVRSSHGVGKTFVAASAALWWVYAHRPSLVLTTAPTQRQVEALLWGEIRRLFRRARVPLPGRLLAAKLEAAPDQQAVGLTTNEPERFAGWHAEHLLVIVDEASGVPDAIFEVVQGTLTSAHCRLLLIGNPTRPTGYFHLSHHQGDWQRLKIAAYDTPNFVRSDGVMGDGVMGEDSTLTPSPHHLITPSPPCPWLVTPEWVEARRQEWGEESDPFRVRVLGEFPRAAVDTLIALEWIERAERADGVMKVRGDGVNGRSDLTPSPPHPLTPSVVFGLDVARFGDCETVLAVREGDRLEAVLAWQGADLMQTCGRVLAEAGRFRPKRLVIDTVGVGGGVMDRLRERQREGDSRLAGVQLVAFGAGERAREPEKFAGRRDEAYWLLRERLSAGTIAFAGRWSRLTGQLCALRYHYNSRGQIKIESKEELRRRGVESPDQADAVAMALAPDPGGRLFLPIAATQPRRVRPAWG